jgi:hypothetical protein
MPKNVEEVRALPKQNALVNHEREPQKSHTRIGLRSASCWKKNWAETQRDLQGWGRIANHSGCRSGILVEAPVSAELSALSVNKLLLLLLVAGVDGHTVFRERSLARMFDKAISVLIATRSAAAPGCAFFDDAMTSSIHRRQRKFLSRCAFRFGIWRR